MISDMPGNLKIKFRMIMQVYWSWIIEESIANYFSECLGPSHTLSNLQKSQPSPIYFEFEFKFNSSPAPCPPRQGGGGAFLMTDGRDWLLNEFDNSRKSASGARAGGLLDWAHAG